jgi:hypothetical protein
LYGCAAGAQVVRPHSQKQSPNRQRFAFFAVWLIGIIWLWWPDANSIALITHSADIRKILDHIGIESELPNIAPVREKQRFRRAAGQACARARPKADLRSVVLLFNDRVGPNLPNQWCFCAPNPCHTSSHVVEFSIRICLELVRQGNLATAKPQATLPPIMTTGCKKTVASWFFKNVN